MNVLVNNAGIQKVEDLTFGEVADAEATINTNLFGPVWLTAALMPHLLAQLHGTILNVFSALAMLPAAMMPSYCASKAGDALLHAVTSLSAQGFVNEVIEIIQPWVQTELQGAGA